MDLLKYPWLQVRGHDGCLQKVSASEIAETHCMDLAAPRADFRAALYQLLIGLLQTTYAPQDVAQWRERYASPPGKAVLEAAFLPYRQAFLLEHDGPAFMQDLALPNEANQLPVLELLIDAGSSSNRYFNKPHTSHGLCESCFTQALLTLQLNAPPGGRGGRTSLRGGRGPLTTLLLPADEHATLWQKLWLNVLPLDALDHPPVGVLSDVLPWLAPTRTSDDKNGRDTPPEAVHPLQAYWSMPRRIRLDGSTVEHGDCSVCGAVDVRLIRHYRTRHNGTNYTGAWVHPLTPYSLDAKGEKPPIPSKGDQARGYRDWLGLVLGNDDHQPDAARVVAHFTTRLGKPKARLWCFGFAMSKMKALCWYDSTLPVHTVEPDVQRAFTKAVKHVLDSAESMASTLHRQVKAAWFRRPGDVGPEPVVLQSFWQGTEVGFYQLLDELAALDFDGDAELAPIYRRWLLATRRQVLALFDHWVLSGPLEDQDMRRVVKARADLVKKLNGGKALKPLWEIVNRHHQEPA